MCDSLVALGSTTSDGTTLFAKNSDRPRGERQAFRQLPAMAHAPGSRLRCTHIEIPQLRETHAVMGHSPSWAWGFEQGVNEHGVAIGNEMVFSNDPIEPTPGLIGIDLVRLGLERGRTGRQALESMAALLETYGQGGPGHGADTAGYQNAFLIADPDEAWVMESSNRRWVARRVTLETLSNHLSAGSDWELGSPDCEGFARRRGWWNEPTRLHFAAAYRNRNVPGRISEGRQRRSQTLLEEARGHVDRSTIEGILRDHFDAGSGCLPSCTPEDERYFTLCSHNDIQGPTTTSLLAPLPRERAAPWPVWIGFATPCTSVFLPVYGSGLIPAELARSCEKPEEHSAWRTFRRLEEQAARDLPRLAPLLRERWKGFEQQVEAQRLVVEADARSATEQGGAEDVGQQLSAFMEKVWRAALAEAWHLLERLPA